MSSLKSFALNIILLRSPYIVVSAVAHSFGQKSWWNEYLALDPPFMVHFLIAADICEMCARRSAKSFINPI